MISSPVRFARDEDLVVLVDPDDVVIGAAPKLEAHREGWLHRAVSVVLFDDTGRLLIQRRADGKYHSGGLWSNTCCGHPKPGESVVEAAKRRLRQELGIADCALTSATEFVYYARVTDGLVEHELDHVLVGEWTGEVRPEPSEVSAIRWIDRPTLLGELADRPSRFTAWTESVALHAWRHREQLRM
jgi:isopentenyl-diphosphate delta-isomerase